jgi:hypothetical protein
MKKSVNITFRPISTIAKTHIKSGFLGEGGGGGGVIELVIRAVRNASSEVRGVGSGEGWEAGLQNETKTFSAHNRCRR